MRKLNPETDRLSVAKAQVFADQKLSSHEIEVKAFEIAKQLHRASQLMRLPVLREGISEEDNTSETSYTFSDSSSLTDEIGSIEETEKQEQSVSTSDSEEEVNDQQLHIAIGNIYDKVFEDAPSAYR